MSQVGRTAVRVQLHQTLLIVGSRHMIVRKSDKAVALNDFPQPGLAHLMLAGIQKAQLALHHLPARSSRANLFPCAPLVVPS